MLCLHPHCPMSAGGSSWSEVLDRPRFRLKSPALKAIAADLDARFSEPPSNPARPRPAPVASVAVLKGLLECCPCLFNQVEVAPNSKAIVHFCEIALGARITDQNVAAAFAVQHPKKPGWKYPPAAAFRGSGGTVMELLCSEVLTSGGIPAMPHDTAKWPVWNMPGHILLNEGKMGDLKALGDILVPCAPTNLIISVKSEKAKERLLYSANSIEGIGFGFFDEPSEFWTARRMQLYKRMGFSAIYMPDTTLAVLNEKLDDQNRRQYAVNINGTALYRPLTQFTADMLRVVGKSAFDL